MAETSDPTLLRGADGQLYFLPPGELDSYRVSEEQAKEATAKLGELAEQAKEQETADVAGFSFDRQLSPSFLGLDNPVAPAMDNSKTVVTAPLDQRSFPSDIFFPDSFFQGR